MSTNIGEAWQFLRKTGAGAEIHSQMSRRAAALTITLVSFGLWVMLARAALGLH